MFITTSSLKFARGAGLLQIFHSMPSRPWAVAAHFALHGCHHKFPRDASRLVFPPLPAAVAATAVYGALRTCLPQAGASHPPPLYALTPGLPAQVSRTKPIS